MMASAIPSGKVGDVKIDGENGEGKRTENGQDLVKKRSIMNDEGRNFKAALSQSEEDTMDDEDDGAKEEENVKEDDVLEDPFELEVSRTSIETEGIKEEMSFEKRPFEEALSQSDNRTMDVSLDVLFKQEQVANDKDGTKNDGMTTADDAEQTVSVIDGGKEDKVVEDHSDQLKKQNDKKFIL